MNGIRGLVLVASVGAFGLLAGANRVLAQASTPRHTNAEVVAIKAQERLLVVRNNDGVEQTLELDDQLVGFGDLRPGDRVMLTLRGEPGRARIEAFAKAEAAKAPSVAVETPEATVANTEEVRAEDAFDRRLAALAQQASRVDNLWNSFRGSCNVTLRGGDYAGGREWLSLWDDLAQVDLSGGSCRDLFNQIVGLGQAVNSGMAAARDAARRALEPGEMREIQKRHSLDWSGWGRTAPERRPV